MTGVVAPSRVVAAALNTSLIADPDEARRRRVIAPRAAETGLPCNDPFRFGPERLCPRSEAAVGALPWVDAGCRRPWPAPLLVYCEMVENDQVPPTAWIWRTIGSPSGSITSPA